MQGQCVTPWALCYCEEQTSMPSQPNPFPPPPPAPPPMLGSAPLADSFPQQASVRPAPIWLQRFSLFVLVMFCLYLGLLMVVVPWWPRIWDQSVLMLAYPWLSAALHNGAIRGIISGIGLIDIWIGLAEAIHYRDYRG